jgi:hypothetical protein
LGDRPRFGVDSGFDVVGRPSCTGVTTLLVDFVKRHGPHDVVVVADRDAPGQRGAESLATALLLYVKTLCVVTPPTGVKDVREWRQHGATPADIHSLIDGAPVRQLQVTSRERPR